MDFIKKILRVFAIIVIGGPIAFPTAFETLSPPSFLVPVAYKLNKLADTLLNLAWDFITNKNLPENSGKLASSVGQTTQAVAPGARTFIDTLVSAWPIFLGMLVFAIVIKIFFTKKGQAAALNTAKSSYKVASNNIKGTVWVLCALSGVALVYFAFASQAGKDFNQPGKGVAVLIPSAAVAILTYILFRLPQLPGFWKFVSTLLGAGILIAIFLVGMNQSPTLLKSNLSKSIPAPAVTDMSSSLVSAARYGLVDTPGIIGSVVGIFGYSAGLSLSAAGFLLLVAAMLVKHLVPDPYPGQPNQDPNPQGNNP